MDAVEQAITDLENVRQRHKGEEADSSIMTSDMEVGSVGGFKNRTSPILAARQVMEAGKRVLVIGNHCADASATKKGEKTNSNSDKPCFLVLRFGEKCLSLISILIIQSNI